MQEGSQTPDQQPQAPPQEVGPLQTPQPPQSIKNDAPTGASPAASQPPTEPEKPKSNKILLFGIALLLVAIIGTAAYLFYQNQNKQTPQPTSYEECVNAQDSVIQESYPATCVTKDGERFIQPLSEEEQQNLKPPTPTPTEQPSDELTYEQDLMLDWKTYSTSTYLFKYPSDIELKEHGASTVALSKWGPTQKADTEFYDGISLIFNPREIPNTTLEDHIQEQVDGIIMLGLGEIMSGPDPITINNYSGLTYTTKGLGINKTIVVQADNGTTMEITDSTVDPGNLGFVDTVNQILSTFEFLE